MNHIITPAGKLRHITNLHPILTLASKVEVWSIVITRKPQGARLEVYFRDGSVARSDFASFTVCENFARHPRRVWSGCNIEIKDETEVTVNGCPATLTGTVVHCKRGLGAFTFDFSKDEGHWTPDRRTWIIDGKEIKFTKPQPKL